MVMKNILMKRFAAKLSEYGKNAAGRLTAFSEKYPACKKKAALVFSCLFCSSICIYIVASSMSEKNGKPFSAIQFHIPRHIGKNTRVPSLPVSEETYQRIEQFRKYLDSLSVADKKTFDKMITARPRLMDSIALFEKLYHAQSKK
jgi:hypothetical protein